MIVKFRTLLDFFIKTFSQNTHHTMFSEKDLSQIASQGISLEIVNQQIQDFADGFPFMQLQKAATVGDGILRLSEEELAENIKCFDKKATDLSLLKFVPASGAATRMFKSLFTFLEEGKKDKSIDQFFEKLNDFAFIESLKKILPENPNENTIADYFLTEKGLGYGSLPKGLLEFHQYENAARTAIEEHLVEGANYANSSGTVKLHFTVSPEHQSKFEALINSVLAKYEAIFNVKYELNFSQQQPSTDTIAVDLDNKPFREKDGSLLFRPAGHGALLANLNEIHADVIFIKNIDNVVPDRLKDTTTQYKKALAGVLLKKQAKIFSYLHQLKEWASEPLLEQIKDFFEHQLCVTSPEGFSDWSHEERVNYFKAKLNRPIRVCGVVKNTGEPGGGPFWCKNQDGTNSLQIVESAQVDMNDDSQKTIFLDSTHFNPVDLICSSKTFKGDYFDLTNFRDPKTGFNTQKTKSGKDLKAQELPGLWNGSMANWNTIFVEVPLITFNPVKTVNDLLRDEHQ